MDAAVQNLNHIHSGLENKLRTGVVVDIAGDGSPRVEYSGNELGPMPARTIVQSARPGDPVLLVFEQGDPMRPIILGVVRDRFEANRAQRLNLNAKEVIVEAVDSLSLRCGDSSLTLRRDGKTILKGGEVVSRASRTNRIKGATVKIN
jgi:hypothetical protein